MKETKVSRNGKREKRNVTKSKESKEVQEDSPTNNFFVGNYGLRRAQRREDMPSMSSEVRKRDLSMFLYTEKQQCACL